jgi:thiol-disulfide isomerase/thioredoxin
VNLPALSGHIVSLSDFKGRKTLVLFWNPGCGFCQRMLPDLKAWEQNRFNGSPDLFVVSTGGVEANHALGLQSSLVLDAEFAVARQFRGGGTPSAVLVDADGKIASELAVGTSTVLALVGVVPKTGATPRRAAKRESSHVGR